MTYGIKTYWRFKGEKAWKEGYPMRAPCGLIRMAPYCQAAFGGPVVALYDIEYKQ